MTSIVNKKYYPSDELADFLGSSRTVTRAEVIKAIWAYAKEADLQTKKKVKIKSGTSRNMAAVKADAELQPVLGRGTFSPGEIAKAISKHLEE
jgi:chromatin remodeling complex protein RSC6